MVCSVRCVVCDVWCVLCGVWCVGLNVRWALTLCLVYGLRAWYVPQRLGCDPVSELWPRV